MKKIKISTALLACTLIFFSCKKDSTTTPANVVPTNPNGTFTWTTNGGSTVISADSSFYRAQFKTIFSYAKISGIMKLQYEINLSAGTPATYTIGGVNAIAYTANSPFFIPTSGNVIITANTGTKVSGTFSGAGTLTAGTSSISGSFTDIPVQ